jgi:chaperonin cofactor prefoldin
LVSGLCENIARVAQVFDSLGNVIVPKTKTKVAYESQESKDNLYLHKLSAMGKAAVKPE